MRPRRPACSASNSIRPRAARSRLAVVRARRVNFPSRMTAPAAEFRPAGGAGMWIEGSSRYTGSRPCRYHAISAPPTISTKSSGATSRPSAALTSRKKFSWAACSGVAAVDALHRGQQRPVEVAALEQRQHVVLEHRLALRVRQELGGVAGAGIQRTWPWHGSSSRRSNRSTRPSSNPARPTPHWSIRARALRSPRRPQQGTSTVDRDLGAGPPLDGVDHRLDLLDGSRPEGSRGVVDRLVLGRRRERRTRRRGDGNEAEHPDDDGRDRDGETAGYGEPARSRRPHEAAAASIGWRTRIRRTSSAASS